MKKIKYLFILITSIIIFNSCDPDEINTSNDLKINFSSDTISFDTVFTTIGSSTKKFKIYNSDKNAIIISSIKLSGGENSAFKFNIDGHKGPEIKNIRIEGKDSCFGFIQVYVNPNNSNSPIIIEDSIEFFLNNTKKRLYLNAWGQDIHLIRDSLLKTQTWIADKPYVLYDAVLVDSNATLTIEEGVTIYMHKNMWFGVNGTLVVNGTKDRPVIFRGDRRDYSNYYPPVPYDVIPGQWNEIRFTNSSKGNKINYAEIRNGQFGIIAGIYDKPGQAEVEISNTKIYNHGYTALFGIKARITAWNCVFANSGLATFMCTQGGNYSFYHCTFANYSAFGIKGSYAAYLRNYTIIDSVAGDPKTKKIYYGELENAYFGNCILYGEIENVVFLDSNPNHLFEYKFENCLIKGTTDKLNISDQQRFVKTKISNKDEVGFVKIDKESYYYDFRLTRTSIARESGSIDIASQYPLDLLGNNRLEDGNPDIGAYEYIPE